MNQQLIYLLIVPLHTKMNTKSLRAFNTNFRNQSYRFQLYKNQEIIGKSETFPINMKSFTRGRISKVTEDLMDEETELFPYEFQSQQNLISIKESIASVQSMKFGWSVMFICEEKDRRRQLKIFSQQCSLKQAVDSYIQNKVQFKFKETLVFGQSEIQLEYKLFIQDSIDDILQLKSKLENDKKIDATPISQQNSPIQKQYKIQKAQTHELRHEVHDVLKKRKQIENRKKFLKVAPIHKTNHLPDRDELVCKTLSLVIPKSPIQRFTTAQQEQQFNQKLQSFLKSNHNSIENDSFLNKKKIIIILIILIVIFFVGFEYNSYGLSSKKQKKAKNGDKKRRKNRSKTKMKQDL